MTLQDAVKAMTDAGAAKASADTVVGTDKQHTATIQASLDAANAQTAVDQTTADSAKAVYKQALTDLGAAIQAEITGLG